MKLHLLPERCGSAAENMATDLLLLQRYPTAPAAVRLRHYTWQRPAITFGYSQKYALVREQLAAIAPDGGHFDLTRRATGGGLVDHRDDWTYALVIPRGHDLEARPASQSYRLVHKALAAALTNQGVPATLKRASDTCSTPKATAQKVAPATQCFQRAECFDVIRADHSGTARAETKIAGAAQKRTKHGLLFQGSVSRAAAAGEATDWDRFYADFATELAHLLDIEVEPLGWPDFAEAELEGLIEQYSSPEWLEYR
ncbi:hypothetical protein AXK12_06275 [Cephaloticoccus capnophilus]|uniref:BPL/LPL catalytic domain-containing protein n=1 Tax=Cephaloticoccus capnophilus TaxID=1548208 RepID=A0A139SKE1_9BACT|nr:hypothetical protein [Cephaloticoccus capnophilus]KXU34970.1 hypothetical protein AXK12_06275 [Cephaloticoccus capnophilus]